MTRQEKRDDMKMRLKAQLKQRVRKHRPAAKVLEMTIALTEERVENVEEQITEMKWQLDYLRKLDPKEIDPDGES